jgi:hypothetical protein
MNPHVLGISPRFAHTPGAELEAHRIPLHIIEFMEQNRDDLQRTAQDQNGFHAALTSAKTPQLDNRAQFSQGSALQAMGRPPQLMASWLQQLQRRGLGPQGKPNALQNAQLYNNGVGRPPTGQWMSVSSIPSVGTQIAAASPSGGAQGQGAMMSGPSGTNAFLTQTAGPMQIRRPTREDVALAHRWVEEQKRTAFGRG